MTQEVVEHPLEARDFVDDEAPEIAVELGVFEPIRQQLKEGLHRDQRIANFVNDLGDEASERSQPVEALNGGVEPAQPLERELRRHRTIESRRDLLQDRDRTRSQRAARVFREDQKDCDRDVAEANHRRDGGDASCGERSQVDGQIAIGEPHRVGDLDERCIGFGIDEEFVRIPRGSGRNDSRFFAAIECPRDGAPDARLTFESTEGFHQERLAGGADAVRTSFAGQQNRIE